MNDHPRTEAVAPRPDRSTSPAGQARWWFVRASRTVRRRLRWAAALAIVVPGLAAAPAQAAVPDFQLPFPCGQVWSGSASLVNNGINFNRADDEGDAVTASAAGHVSVASGGSNFGTQVVIQHESGYSTRYAYLQDVAVAAGDSVRQGQLLGWVGATGGAYAPNLFYQQLLNGAGVQAVFDGVTFVDPGQTLTSHNCGGGANDDFTGDRLDDLVGAHSVNGDLYRFEGTGGAVASGAWMSDAWTGMRLISSGDLTGDGHADVVALNGETADLYLYVGNGAGGFSSSKVIGNNWSQIRMITMGDFNSDGRDDVVALHGGTGNLLAYPAAGTGSNPSLGAVFQLGSGWTGIRLMTSGDFNQDSRDDIVAVSGVNGNLYLYPGIAGGIGNGTSIQSNWTQVRLLSAIDFNNDGTDDLAAVNSVNGNLYRYYGTGAGNVGGGTSIGTGWTNIRLLGT